MRHICVERQSSDKQEGNIRQQQPPPQGYEHAVERQRGANLARDGTEPRGCVRPGQMLAPSSAMPGGAAGPPSRLPRFAGLDGGSYDIKRLARVGLMSLTK